MQKNILIFNILTSIILVFVFIPNNKLNAQSKPNEMMGKLNFMVGDWIGTSTSFKNDTIVKQVPAHQKISYKLDSNIITIDLKSETLQLHTVIYFDKKERKFYYNPFYINGAGKYIAEVKEGRLIVWPNENTRFIFQLTSKGNFQEYGENLVDGKWIKYFEDNFNKVHKD
jgi:hypothetical protein